MKCTNTYLAHSHKRQVTSPQASIFSYRFDALSFFWGRTEVFHGFIVVSLSCTAYFHGGLVQKTRKYLNLRCCITHSVSSPGNQAGHTVLWQNAFNPLNIEIQYKRAWQRPPHSCTTARPTKTMVFAYRTQSAAELKFKTRMRILVPTLGVSARY